MAEAKITIRCLKDITTKDNAHWPKGTDLITTREELTRRGVPQDAYKVVKEEVNRQDAESAKPETQKK